MGLTWCVAIPVSRPRLYIAPNSTQISKVDVNLKSNLNVSYISNHKTFFALTYIISMSSSRSDVVIDILGHKWVLSDINWSFKVPMGLFSYQSYFMAKDL